MAPTEISKLVGLPRKYPCAQGWQNLRLHNSKNGTFPAAAERKRRARRRDGAKENAKKIIFLEFFAVFFIDIPRFLVFLARVSARR